MMKPTRLLAAGLALGLVSSLQAQELETGTQERQTDGRFGQERFQPRELQQERFGPMERDYQEGVREIHRADRLIGMDVINHLDENLGTIRDIVADLPSGRISYVVLGTGGFLGIGERLIAIPPQALAPGLEQQNLVLHASRQRIEEAVGFPGDQWPDVRDPAWGAGPLWNELEEQADRPGAYQRDQRPEPDNQQELRMEAGPAFQQPGRRIQDRPYQPQRRDAFRGRDFRNQRPGERRYGPKPFMGARGVTDANRLSRVIGMNVKNDEEENLGKINEVVLNLETGRISYVVLGTGGFLGVGARQIAVPPDAFDVGPEQDRLLLAADRRQIEQAPALTRGAWPPVEPGIWGARTQEFRDEREYERPLRDRPEPDRDRFIRERDLERGEDHRPARQEQSEDARQASELIGQTVVNHRGETLGEIRDLVLDIRTGRISYVVLGVEEYLGVRDRQVAVPPTAFEFDPRGRELVLRADRERLERAPVFTRDRELRFPEPAGDGEPRERDRRLLEREPIRERDRMPERDERSFRGTVTAIDPQNRMMTVEGPRGEIEHFVVAERATLTMMDRPLARLGDFSVGYTVNVGYYRDPAGFNVARSIMRVGGPIN